MIVRLPESDADLLPRVLEEFPFCGVQCKGSRIEIEHDKGDRPIADYIMRRVMALRRSPVRFTAMQIRLSNDDRPLLKRVQRAFPGAEVVIGVDRTNVTCPNEQELHKAIGKLDLIRSRAMTLRWTCPVHRSKGVCLGTIIMSAIAQGPMRNVYVRLGERADSPCFEARHATKAQKRLADEYRKRRHNEAIPERGRVLVTAHYADFPKQPHSNSLFKRTIERDEEPKWQHAP